jgi:hypothetical protein
MHPFRSSSQRCRAAVLAGAVLAAAVVLSPSSPTTARAAVASQVLPSTASGIHEFTGIQGDVGHNFTASELATIAAHADIVVALQIQIAQYGAALHADNPGIKLFAYQNGMFAQSSQGSTFPKTWYLYDRSGGKVMSKSNHNYLMNPLSTAPYMGAAGWAAYVASQCASKVASAPFTNGCYLDQVSSAGDTAFVTSPPVDPRTGQLFRLSDYMNAVTHVVDTTAAKTAVIGNSYESGIRYYGNSTNMLDASNGAAFEAEHWMGATQPRDAETLSKWKMDVQMLIDSQRHGHGVLVNFEDMSTNVTQWEAFNVATMLLGNNGHVWIHFDSSASTGVNFSNLQTQMMTAAIGSPTETYSSTDGYLRGGVYQRSFTRGRVLVNPSGSAVSVNLGATMKTLGGASVSSVKLAAYTGTVLLS